ncbi:MAG: DUF882 domain-containing protein [Acidobacteria bacterium]|nr:DUF882 domain-containing protein [Acidobacteriota bacterium]
MRTGIRLSFALAIAALIGLSGFASAKDADTSASVRPDDAYRLRLHHLHTGESIDVVYRVGDTYLPDGIAKLNYFLRDHRTQTESRYDPKEFDLLHSLLAKLGRPNGEIDIVCGYRTPWSNKLLRSRSANSGVAEHSQHMQARAIDIRVPGVTTARLRDAALSLRAGGVGYYPVNQFVHVDVGPVREWSYGQAGRRRAQSHSIARARRRTPHHAPATATGE